jgi:acid phosphatase (class A)
METLKLQKRILIFSLTFALVLMSGCNNMSIHRARSHSSLTKELNELQPGILEGYLSRDQLPNSLIILPQPPAEGSAEWTLDMELAKKYLEMEDEDRKELAKADAELHFPEATEAFNRVLNMDITEEKTPLVYVILRRSLTDAALSTYQAKNQYKRPRPFMVIGGPTCTPDVEEYLREDGSYPSGHTAIGWTWALILAELFPEQADIIMVRGEEFGTSRNICNVHWHSDVVAGRMMGASVVARLHANDDFMMDMIAARAEIQKIRKKGQ